MLMCILACLSCAVAYEAIGSHIAEDGRLVEPFGLIPLFWLFLLIGAVFTAGFLIARRHPKKAAR